MKLRDFLIGALLIVAFWAALIYWSPGLRPEPQIRPVSVQYLVGKRSEPGVMAPGTVSETRYDSEMLRRVFTTGRDPFQRVK